MEKKYLVFVLSVIVAFGLGLVSGLIIAKQGVIDYSAEWNFEGAGFKKFAGKEMTGQIKEIKGSSLVLSFAGAGDVQRMKKMIDKEVVVNDGTELWLKRVKTDEERYGSETWKQITALDEERNKISPRESRERYTKLSQQIADLKQAANLAWSLKANDLSKQIVALGSEETLQLAQLNQQLQAIVANYTLTAIKLSDLQVGETVTLSNEKEIDLNGEVVAERIVITR